MSDPRNKVAFDEINAERNRETFLIDNSTVTYDATKPRGSAQVDLAVTLSADQTVALAADGEGVLGKLISVEHDGKAVVQTGGYMTLPGGDGATLTLMSPIVGDLGAASAKGYIRPVNSAVAAELAVARGNIINKGTATAVVVRM